MSDVGYIYEVVYWEYEQACELPWGIPSVPQMAYSGSLDSGCVTEDTLGKIPMGGIGTEVKVRYTVVTSKVDVVGHIWMPNAQAAMSYTLSGYDLENIRGGDGTITREDVQGWLDTHAGDFQSIDDFRADISDGDEDIVFQWATEEGELAYYDCMGDFV